MKLSELLHQAAKNPNLQQIRGQYFGHREGMCCAMGAIVYLNSHLEDEPWDYASMWFRQLDQFIAELPQDVNQSLPAEKSAYSGQTLLGVITILNDDGKSFEEIAEYLEDMGY